MQTHNNQLIVYSIEQAVQHLKNGELVVFPTETVYGLGADASNATAVSKVFQIKNRPTNRSVIVHIPDLSHLEQWTRKVSAKAQILAEHFWPGPLTLILPKQANVIAEVTGGLETVGLRVPNHPVALELLQQFNGGIVGPSANRYGYISPTQSKHIATSLGIEVPVLEGGACAIGIESTVVSCIDDEVQILRQGMISAEQIENLVGPISDTKASYKNRVTNTPGTDLKHYAPNKALKVLAFDSIYKEIQSDHDQKNKFLIYSFNTKPESLKTNITWQQAPDNPNQYAQQLYDILHQYEQSDHTMLVIESVPNRTEWRAIKDRLQRACYK